MYVAKIEDYNKFTRFGYLAIIFPFVHVSPLHQSKSSWKFSCRFNFMLFYVCKYTIMQMFHDLHNECTCDTWKRIIILTQWLTLVGPFLKTNFFTLWLNVRHKNLLTLLEMKILGQTTIEPILMQIFICGFNCFPNKKYNDVCPIFLTMTCVWNIITKIF